MSVPTITGRMEWKGPEVDWKRQMEWECQRGTARISNGFVRIRDNWHGSFFGYRSRMDPFLVTTGMEV